MARNFRLIGTLILLGVGICNLVLEAMSIHDGSLVRSASWMGQGQWFAWVLAMGLGLTALVQFTGARLWWRDQSKLAFHAGIVSSCGNIGFQGPTSKPSQSLIPWLAFTTSILMLLCSFALFYVSDIAKRLKVRSLTQG